MTPSTRIATPFDTCSLCPRLCRSACPVASSGRELGAPTWIATVLRDWRRGDATAADAAEVATLCTDCGACRALCHLDRPVPELLRAVRLELGLEIQCPEPEPLGPIVGEGDAIVVEADERPLGAHLARVGGSPVRSWRTGDRLGAASVEGSRWPEHAARVREAVGAAVVVTADGGVAEALRAAGVAFRWAWDWLGDPPDAVGSCAAGGERPLACCGGAGPLPRHHPGDAERVARLFAARGEVREVADARCRAHLRAAGVEVTDWVDRLLARELDGEGA
jgi:ferredoxin